jgi:hypothetical protein
MGVIVPPTGNETISMLKTTSLVSVIAVSELLDSAIQIYAGGRRPRCDARPRRRRHDHGRRHHEMAFVREVGDSLVFMDGGVIVESGTPREVLARPRHERTREFLAKVL